MLPKLGHNIWAVSWSAVKVDELVVPSHKLHITKLLSAVNGNIFMQRYSIV